MLDQCGYTILSYENKKILSPFNHKKIFLIENQCKTPIGLMSGRLTPARIWLILDLARNRCPDSENQDTIDDSL